MAKNISVYEKRIVENNIFDISGSNIQDFLIDCISKFNRGINPLVIRTTGRNISNCIELAHMMQEEFKININNIKITSCYYNNVKIPEIQITLESVMNKNSSGVNHTNYLYPLSKFIEYPVYQVLLDWLLYNNHNLKIYDRNNHLLLSLSDQNGSLSIVREVEDSDNKKLVSSLGEAFYRSGLLFPKNWKEIFKKISEFDDIIIGIDTNILLNCSLTTHLLPLISILDNERYTHTPNWILFVIPNAVMHEIEEAANARYDDGGLKFQGRLAFRALQDIFDLELSKNVAGVSVLIVGEANPVLDTRVELQGLRADFRRRNENCKSIDDVNFRPLGSPKISSGDMIIRDQFKRFLRQIDFHKGTYFLTADKSCAALARAEGLYPLYLKFPYWDFRHQNEYTSYELYANKSINIHVPIGRLIYELAVQFGKINIGWGNNRLTIRCDSKGENLDFWLKRKLMIDKNDFNKVMKMYQGIFPISEVAEIWKNLSETFEGRI